MRRMLEIVLMLATGTCLVAQAPKEEVSHLLTYTAPDPASPVIGERLRKLPIQINMICKTKGAPEGEPFTGTGFVVGVPVPPAEKNLAFDYIVTNRHVAECWDDSNHPQELVSIAARINNTDGGASEVPLSKVNANWYFPTDDSVDLAVIPFAAPPGLDLPTLGFNSFATHDSFRLHRIGEGSTVVVTGVFVQFPGQRKFQSILRQGIVSMIPDEPLVTTTGKLGTVYLADVHVFGGNSGSPVLASPQDDLTHSGERWFIGIVSGYYSEKANSKMEIALTVHGETQTNSGVAMIVPADEVKKLIETNPALKAERDAYLSTLPGASATPAKP